MEHRKAAMHQKKAPPFLAGLWAGGLDASKINTI